MIPDPSRVVWRKSSWSGGDNGDCVEVAQVPPAVAVRDSKNPTGPALMFSPSAFGAFLGAVQAGKLDV